MRWLTICVLDTQEQPSIAFEVVNNLFIGYPRAAIHLVTAGLDRLDFHSDLELAKLRNLFIRYSRLNRHPCSYHGLVVACYMVQLQCS